jgi:outer membrane protein assembly factor BamB
MKGTTRAELFTAGSTRGLLAAVGLAAFGLACAVPVSPSSSSTRGGDPATVRAALTRAGEGERKPENKLGRAMAFVVARTASGGAELIAYDLEGKSVRWRQPAEVAGRVAVAGEVVVYTDRKGVLIGRDVATGAVRWQRGLDSAFTRMGYAASGNTVAEVVQTAGGSSARAREAAIVAYDASSGSQRFSRDVTGPVGAPTVWRNLVVVPRQSQWVSLVDGQSGQVLAEILSREEAANFVRGLPEGLFFGSQGVFLASEKTAVAERKSPAYMRAQLPAFVRPLYHYDMYRPAEVDYSAIDRNRLLWRASPSGEGTAFAGGAVVVHNFRFFFALDAASGGLRWAYNQPRTDAIASTHTGRAILFVTGEGVFKTLDASSGAVTYEASLAGGDALTVSGATFDAEGFGPGTGGGSQTDPNLVSTLASILWDPDRRFTDVRMFALEELTKMGGPDVARQLLRALDIGEVVVPAPVLKKTMEVLVARQDRSLLPVYMEALRVRPDYAEDRQPKRLDFFARAVTTLKAKEAIPLLVEHLRLPDTDLQAVAPIAEAAIALEAREALEPFQDFLLQYRADPAFVGNPAPLIAACNVLLKLGGAKQRSLLLFVAEAPHTIEPVSSHLQRSLVPEDAVKGVSGGHGE